MNKEQQELLDVVYKKYQTEMMFHPEDNWLEELDGMCLGTGEMKKVYRQYAPKEFINKCKTDTEFSERWGLKIEERELSEDDINDLKLKLILDYLNKKNIITVSFEDFKNDENKTTEIDWRREVWDMIGWIDYGRDGDRNKLKEVYDNIKNIPTKLITITYNDKTLESYE
jgi:hypothetical protein